MKFKYTSVLKLDFSPVNIISPTHYKIVTFTSLLSEEHLNEAWDFKKAMLFQKKGNFY